MKNKLQVRRRLFDLYSKNMSFFLTDEKLNGMLACPICEIAYPVKAVETETLYLDLAHVFPDACGGKDCVLTCKQCNSRLGAKFDSHLAKEKHLHDVFSGKTDKKLKAKLALQDAVLNVTLTKTGENFHFDASKQNNHLPNLKVVEEVFTSGKIKFEMIFDQPDDKNRSVAFLSAAYLALYRHFGFEYLLCCETQWIRDILKRDNAPESIPFRTLLMSKQDVKDTGTDPRFIVSVVSFDNLHCWAVGFPMPSPEWPTLLVFLPGPGKEGYEQYQAIYNLPEQRQNCKFRGELFAPEQRLSDPSHMFYMRKLWSRYARKSA